MWSFPRVDENFQARIKISSSSWSLYLLMVPNSQFPRLKILYSSRIIFLLGPNILHMPPRANPWRYHLPSQWSTSLLLALKSPVICSWWRPDKAGSQASTGFKPGLELLTQPWRLIRMPSFPWCPPSHAITPYFVIFVALSTSHLTHHILVYIMCEVYFLYKTRISLRAGNVQSI